MGSTRHSDKLITGKTIKEHFRDAVTDALRNQSVKAGADTVHYVVTLLATFARCERLYERGPQGVVLKPLAAHYAEAVQGPSEVGRNRALRRLGDIALFIAGVFSQSLNRKLVDVDYYVAMGGGAYGHLSEKVRGTARSGGLGAIFAELSAKFVPFVDVLGEVSERTGSRGDKDLLRLYDLWARTGSQRAARQLRQAGIEPLPTVSTSRQAH